MLMELGQNRSCIQHWKETGDISVWKGIAQDALIMNIDDLLCVGATDNIFSSSTIANKTS
jgi:phosphoribosylaminoimidazole (AIR) synthetase